MCSIDNRPSCTCCAWLTQSGVNSQWPVPYDYLGPFQSESWSDDQKHFAAAVWAQDQIVGEIIGELEVG